MNSAHIIRAKWLIYKSLRRDAICPRALPLSEMVCMFAQETSANSIIISERYLVG
jgi:hypothetical protein